MFSLSRLIDYKKDPLSYRLLFWILFISAIFTLIMTSIQLYDDYHSDRRRLDDSLLQITDSTLPAVGHALWTMNKPQLDTILNGVLDQRDMQFVKVVDYYGNVVTAIGQPDTRNLINREYPINVEQLGKSIHIGKLHVSATLENIYQSLYHKVLLILGTQGIKTFLMSLCILLLVERLIIRHLVGMGDWAREVKDGSSKKLLTIARNSSERKDAFDYLVESINRMKLVLSEELEEKQRVEKNLQQSEERFKTLYEKNPSMLFSVSADGLVLSANQSGLTHLGFSKQEIINKPVTELFYEDDKDKASEKLMNCFRDKEKVHAWELRKQCKNGNVIYVKEVVRIIKDTHDEDIALIVCEDVTRQKESEETIYRYSKIFEESLNEIYQFDAKTFKFIQVNKAAQENLGYSMAELLNMTPLNIAPEFTEEMFKQAMSPLINNERELLVFESVHQRKDGSFYDVEVHLQLLNFNDGAVFAGIVLDISDRKNANQELEYQATHDSLTGLINRQEFERRAGRLLNTVNEPDQIHALCFMDLDQFKIINDTCGHTAGDELLRQVSQLLDENVRKRDTLARLGGDEFGLLMEHCPLEDANRVAGAIRAALEGFQFAWDNNVFKVTVSIGLIQINQSINSLSDLFKLVDSACYMAKEKGRNRIHVYRQEDEDMAQRHGEMQWVSRITQALDDDRFMLMAQPITPINEAKHLHYELLLRMIDENGNIIMPGAFLPAAERYSLTTNIDYWVVTHAFVRLTEHPAFLDQIDYCAINLSGHSFNDESFLQYVINVLEKTGLPGNKICFEITETAVISHLHVATAFINQLKVYGCQFALDDFGSGLSSFGYLKNLSVDYLKIDGMFVRDIADDPIDKAMVKSINDIGQVMGMKTIAEFVENDIVLGMLKEIGVNYAQGYGVGKLIEFDKLIDRSMNITRLNAR